MKQVEAYLKELIPTDDLEENISNNFRFHYGRVLISYILGKESYTDKDLLSLELENIDSEIYNVAFKRLKDIVIEYKKTNSKKDLVNISKTISFSEYITKNLFIKVTK